MTLIRLDPFYRLAQDYLEQPATANFVRPFSPLELAVDMYETGDAVVLTMAVPGIPPSDLQVTITKDMLTIKGESKPKENVPEKDYVFRERHYGSFVRSFTLPQIRLNLDAAKAEFENGVLTLTVPKKEEQKPKSIRVKAK